MNPFGLDNNTITEIERAFGAKQQIAERRKNSLFRVFEETRNDEEKLALRFLYAYMPLNDLTDYDGQLFLSHVQKSLDTLKRVPWGSKISGDLYLFYILPYRISNETIEDYRGYFYDELIDRVKDKSMYDAILEINHWCHEKATYIATDPRTASPLTVVRTALGRCGEESALLVAALRSLCIPARQCYTPRWAHQDDNHAWVEAWADGSWYFLGACEPEPRLNMGWFAGPARRAMLVNTRVPGCYSGPEESVQVHDGFTGINLLSNYAATRKVTVAIRDGKGQPVQGARVSFCVFNYGGFSPITRLKTDKSGEVKLTTGSGDLFIYAHDENGYGYTKVGPGTGDRAEIVLSDELAEGTAFELEMVPPPDDYKGDQDVTKEEREAHNLRLKEEDRIRAEYESTFVKEEEARELAEELGLPSERVCSVVKKARGNSHEIVDFLRTSAPQYGEYALSLLEAVSDKDLTDTCTSILMDHLEGAMTFKSEYDHEVFVDNVLNPRVSLEVLRPYRRFFQEEFSTEDQHRFRSNPKLLVDWVASNISSAPEGHLSGCATPRGTYELGLADSQSRKVLFVALARSFGVPARLNRADQRAQYFFGQSWVDAHLDPDELRSGGDVGTPTGKIQLRLVGDYDEKVEYFRQFTIAQFDGFSFRTLNFRGLDSDELQEPLSVTCGYYWLTTGNRLTDGTVLVRVQPFRVKPDRTTEVELRVRKDSRQLSEFGSIPDGIEVRTLDGSVKRLDELIGGDGAVFAWIEPDREPSKHLIRELSELKDEFDRVRAEVCLFIDEQHLTASFRQNDYSALPEKAYFGLDRASASLDAVAQSLTCQVQKSLPFVLVVSPDRKVRYVSAGYKLGTGANILKVLK